MERLLYGYFRSSAAYRVRIALNYKGLEAKHMPVNLIPGIDAQKSEDYRALNPQGRVPFYIDGDIQLGQSPAIMEYLEEKYPEPPLLPEGASQRAYVRQLSSIISCDVHPLNNLSVLKYIKTEFGADGDAVNKWYVHWISAGFEAFENIMVESGAMGKFCFGDTVTLADVYLVPQVYNARRFGVDLGALPEIVRIESECLKLKAFQDAVPENQADAP